MPLSCYCDEEPPGGFSWYFTSPTDYSDMPARQRRKRCASCGELIEPGSTVTRFNRWRPARSDVEAKIYGEDGDCGPTLAPMYHCETCADLWFSLEALGFECIGPDEPVRILVREYVEIYR